MMTEPTARAEGAPQHDDFCLDLLYGFQDAEGTFHGFSDHIALHAQYHLRCKGTPADLPEPVE